MACYILFSRQPDFFDGELTQGIVHTERDSTFVKYTVDKKSHQIVWNNMLLHFDNSQQVNIIYEAANPSKGAVYTIIGYWLSWGEILFTIIGFVALFGVAVSITNNPSAESLIEQLEYQPRKKTKYD